MNVRQRALISVFDKTGIIDMAQALLAAGFELLSTGGTAKLLRDQGLAVTDVADVTGQAEIMGVVSKACIPRSMAVFWRGWTIKATRKKWREMGSSQSRW